MRRPGWASAGDGSIIDRGFGFVKRVFRFSIRQKTKLNTEAMQKGGSSRVSITIRCFFPGFPSASAKAKEKTESGTRIASRLSLAEMKRFELLRRFEPTYRFECVRNFRTWRNLTEDERSCGNPKKPEFPRVLRRQKRKKRGDS